MRHGEHLEALAGGLGLARRLKLEQRHLRKAQIGCIHDTDTDDERAEAKILGTPPGAARLLVCARAHTVSCDGTCAHPP